MKCSCIKGTFDFDLLYTTCKDITFIDRSVWMEGTDFDPTRSYTLTITHPGGSTTTHDVVVGIPLHLDFGECPNPGVYRFSTTSCGELFQKDWAMICTLKCGYLRAVAKVGTPGIETVFLRSIRERIEDIPNVVSYGSIVEAQGLTETVRIDLRKVNCDCQC